MSKRNKIFRDAPAGLLMTISLALSLFVLLNVTELMDKIITESKSQQKYNYSYEFTVCFQEAEEKSLEDVQIEKLQDILMNVRVGNLSFINAYIGVDKSMCRFPAEILFTANENLKYQFKHKDAEDAQWEIAISSELGNYMKKENDGYKIRILGEWCKVYDNFEIGSLGDGAQDIVLNFENTKVSFDRVLEEILSFQAGRIEMKLESDRDISSSYEELKEQLEKELSAQVEPGTLSNETDYKTVWNRSLKSIFLPFTFVFAMINCIVVSDLWFSRRRHELIVRKAYGYTTANLCGFIVKEIGKIAVLAFVFAVLMQFIYTLITGNIGEFFKISLIKVSIMAIGMLVIVLVVALFPMKRINKISLAEAFTE